MSPSEFTVSLGADAPPASLSPPLAALWWLSNNHWQRAHDLIDAEAGSAAAWVHAHLHRIEGDHANARYWYARAGRDLPTYGLTRELEILLENLLPGG